MNEVDIVGIKNLEQILMKIIDNKEFINYYLDMIKNIN